jgi:hypothetical protein
MISTKEADMIAKQTWLCLFIVILSVLAFHPVFAQMQSLKEFKNVDIPFNLKFEDLILESGKYTLEFIKHGMGDVFYLRVKKKNKTICLIPKGERVKYKDQSSYFDLMDDPDIPDKPKLNIKRNPALKIAYIIFETGKKSKLHPFLKIRFKLEYE